MPALSSEEQAHIDSLRREYGDDVDIGPTLSPRIPVNNIIPQRPLTTRDQVDSAAVGAVSTLADTIAEDQGSLAGADALARERLAEIVNVPRTADGEAAPRATRADDMMSRNTLSALLRSFGRQVVETQTGEESIFEAQQIEEARSAIMLNAGATAQSEARAQNIPLAERPEFIQRRTQEVLGSSLNDEWGVMYRRYRAELMLGAGLDPSNPIPEENSEIREQASFRARREYDSTVGSLFGSDPLSSGPDDSKISKTWYGRTGQFIVGREGQLLEIAERVRNDEDTGWDQARLRYHRLWRRRTDDTGEVAETVTGAAVRDAVGIVAPVAYAVFRAATWDRNPETGLPYNENDLNYKISQWADGLVNNMEEGDNGILTRFENTLANAISAPFRGAYNIEDSRLSTGNWTKDFAIAHANGEWTGSLIDRLQSVNALRGSGSKVWANYGTIAGLGIDANWFRRLPSMAAGVGRATEVSARQIRRISEAAGVENVSRAMKWMEIAGSEGDSVRDIIIKYRLARDLADEGGVKGNITGDLLDGSEAVHTRTTRILADDMGTRIVRSETPAELRRLFPTLDEGSMLDNIVQEVFIAQHRMRTMFDNGGIAGLKADSQGRRIYHHMVESSRALKDAPPEVISQATVKSLLEEKLSTLVQQHTPHDWVFVNSDTIVRKSAWDLRGKEVTSMASDLMEHTTILSKGGRGAAGTRFIYKNREAAANALVAGLRGEGYTSYWKGIADKIRAGKAIDHSVFKDVNDMALGHVANQIMRNAVEASDFSAKIASVRTIGRDLRSINDSRNMLKALKSLGGASSDYKWIMKKQKGGFGSTRPNVDEFVSKTPARFRTWHATNMNEFSEVERSAEKLIRSAVDHDNIQNVFNHVSSGDVAKDYATLLDIFWRAKGHSGVSDYLNQATLAAAVKAGGSTVNAEGIRRVIASVRDRLTPRDLAELNKTGLKKRRLVLWLSGEDNINSLMVAYIVHGMKEKLWTKAFNELNEQMPDLLLTTPTRIESGARFAIFSRLMRANGLSDKHIDLLKNNVKQMLDSSPSDKKVIATAVIKHMFEEGGLATANDLARMTQAVRETVAWIATHADEATGVQKQFQSSYEGMRQVIGEAVRVNPSLGTVDEILEATIPAVVKAVSDVDINGIRARFAAFGLESRAAPRGADAPAPAALRYNDFKDAGRFVIDQRMDELFTQLQKPGQLDKVNAAFDGLRASERSKFSFFFDMLNITKRTSVTGLLGGGALFGSRFFGTNNLSAPIIAAVTSPDYVMDSIKAVPSATGDAVIRSMRRSGFGFSEDVYDYQRARYVMKPDEIMFQTPSGETWTKHMFDEALNKYNLRFSQATHEFAPTMFQEVVRAAENGPAGKSLREYTQLPWSNGLSIARTKYWAFLRPDQRSFYSMIGEEADNIQREAIFRAALKHGAPINDAALLARNSMLDYGRLAQTSPKIQAVAKNIAFFSFFYNMTREVLEAIVKDGRSLTNIRRTLAMVNAQRESMEQWVLEPDSAKLRIQLDPVLRHFSDEFETYSEDFGRWETKNLGIQIPFGSHYSMLMNASYDIFRVSMGDITKMQYLRMTGGAATEMLTNDPRLGIIKDLANQEIFGEAPTGFIPSGAIDIFARLPAGMGGVGTAIDWFDLEAIDEEDERPDMAQFVDPRFPEEGARQYKFGSVSGERTYNIYKGLLLISAMGRNLTDYPRLAYRMGWIPEGVEPRRDGQGHPFMFGAGGTVISYPSPIVAQDRIYRAILRDISDEIKD